MEFVSLNCPACGGLLPRQARWRMVNCPYCGSVVTLAERVVQAVDFHQARLRAQAAAVFPCESVVIGDDRYRLLSRIGSGEHADIFFAERMSILPERVTVKLARDAAGASALEAEFSALNALQSLEAAGSAYYSQRLPQPVRIGAAALSGLPVAVYRHNVGFWGSLEDVMAHHSRGVDPRHAVWMWRRILEVLSYLHRNGWTHGMIHPQHLLVHPANHGVLLIGWERASKDGERSAARDLSQSAWSIRAALSGPTDDEPGFGTHTPGNMVEILKRASEDADWCSANGAAGIDEALKAAAFEAFGPPAFVPFSPVSPA